VLDVFNHFTPRAFFSRLEKLIPGHPVLNAFPQLPALLDLDARLRLIDANSKVDGDRSAAWLRYASSTDGPIRFGALALANA
jgi:hypothetical protein